MAKSLVSCFFRHSVECQVLPHMSAGIQTHRLYRHMSDRKYRPLEKLDDVGDQQPDLQNTLRQSYDYLTIMPKLRSTYDGCLIYQTSYEERKAFLRYDLLAKIVGDSVCKWLTIFPREILARCKSLSYVDLTTNLG